MSDVTGTPLTPTEFASVVTAITSAFGDPTRRDIYLFVHEQGLWAARVQGMGKENEDHGQVLL